MGSGVRHRNLMVVLDETRHGGLADRTRAADEQNSHDRNLEQRLGCAWPPSAR
jgi:hypothetical protein